ncbi:Mss4-like protein [Schizophyllum amplum]|uniref:Mss4-like protein n=1 Tax=Schizophyllum amplum TaxID=97359 RepID=A0A550CFG4_9AGAR|nr:Mss4-like protein [Auriculariopsis ampla]
MPTGGCFCGAVRYTYTGEPAGKAICHCLDCRKISGTTYSTNVLIPADALTLTAGTPKTYSCVGGSGKPITNFLCGDCGSTMWREIAAYPGMKVVKAGTLDAVDALDLAKPETELFVTRRTKWVQEVQGVAQKEQM